MMNKQDNSVDKLRLAAILKLFLESNGWQKNGYTQEDFIVDKALRITLKLPPRDLGKPPYEDISIYL